MEREDASPLADILGATLHDLKIDGKMKEMDAVQAWYDIMGTTGRKYTDKIFASKGKLYIRLNSPALKNDLMMGRTQLVTTINNKAGGEVINEIIFI